MRKPEGAFYIFPEFEGPADSETVSLELLESHGDERNIAGIKKENAS